MAEAAAGADLRGFLHAATAPLHGVVDEAFSRFDVTTDDGLAAFLEAHARAVPALEDNLEQSGIGVAVADWPRRRRTAALLADLDALGRGRPRPLRPPDLPTAAHRLGALYVLEGSRLGGAYLARQARAGRRDHGVMPALAFLDHGRADRLWPSFVVLLNVMGAGLARADVLSGAERTFALFLDAARISGP